MLPETNPETEHTISCMCASCLSYFTMGQTNFTNQRADKIRFEEIAGDYEPGENEHIVEVGGRKRLIVEYTVTCPDCDGDGRYDDRGDIICDDCGVVINGNPLPLSVEYSESSGMGSGRGLEKFTQDLSQRNPVGPID